MENLKMKTCIHKNNNKKNFDNRNARYIAEFLYNKKNVVDKISLNNKDRLLAKSIIYLEKKYPNAICRIQDRLKKRTLHELKVRHYLE